jgi:ribosome biogenesis protein MAK21
MVDKKSTKKAPRRRGKKGEEKKSIDKNTIDGATKPKQQHGTLLVTLTEDAPTWFACARQTPGRDDSLVTHPGTMTAALVAQYRAQADDLYKRELQAFHQSKTMERDDQWVENTMKRGTLKDRIAAMSVIVSTDPVHKLHALDGLLSMATNPNTRMAQMAAEALEDLFLRTLLPPERKLLPLHQRPLHLYQDGNKTLSPRILLLWRFEEMLQEKYKVFLNQYLLHTLQNGLDVNKISALRTASALLRGVPEGEAQLLGMLVNKLGDPSKKIAAGARHELRLVLEQHANMQTVIAREVQQLAHRPHLSPRALYNCIIFLNQLQLTANDNTNSEKQKTLSLPASLVNTYFCLFEVAVQKQKDEGLKSRLLSALLTGVNRAHPYLPEQDKDLEQHMDSLYRVVHTGPPSATTQALMLLFHVAIGSHPNDTDSNKKTQQYKMRQDRFYRALYATLALPSVVASGKHLTMYFNLLYKAMKHDDNTSRVNAMAKRLLCTTMHATPPVMAASLFLIGEIAKTREELKSCLVNVAQGESAMAVLDATKRQPEAALVHPNGESVGHAHLWETSLLANHYHPSVCKFASGNVENYSGDPLRDFSLAPFLDKFAYRNPKTNKNSNNKRGESIAERQRNNAAEAQQLPVNDPSFLEKDYVNEQDEFFQTYFAERARRDEIKGVVRNKTNADENEEEDEAFDIAENFTTGQTFGQDWETDSEEEAFVDSLAEKLIEDAAGAEMDLDDEDPDMEGWDDMYAGEAEGDDEDAFMDKVEDMSGDEDSDENKSPSSGEEQQNDNDDDAFMDASDSDESDNDREDPTFDEPDGNEISEDDDEACEDDLVLLNDSDSDDTDSVSNTSSDKKKQRKTKRDDVASDTFADASEYEELINKSWQQVKTTKSSFVEVRDEEAGMDGVPVQPSKHSSNDRKRKRHPKKKKKKQLS